MFIIQYPPPDIGNSFCLVVRIVGSEPKCPQFYPRTATVVTRKITQHLLSVPLLDGSITNSIYFYINQIPEPQLLHQALPNSKSMTISQHKACTCLRTHINGRLQWKI
ncbi:hypothetical protein AVEN_137736-1 [Araneus ventricosus]|uniref:Uncharacterized protein n=1 Tax=Araneus ventricosus TaxID=182803 RepID=A0A4Y2MB12_ARAVE|nr:hypothetical protein AVEN_267267-1 [Araneus ventricosus]GBO28863.1 hypothetical protein AVEN_137736-1 [Araneus ventricosus]